MSAPIPLTEEELREATEIIAQIGERMDRLRALADELRRGHINRHHAANRLDKIVSEIAGPKERG